MSMENRHDDRALRPYHGVQPLARQAKPVPVKKTVSVRHVFKHPLKAAKQHPKKPHHPDETGTRVSKKRKLDQHPLAVAFRDSGDAYRRHLYTSTTLQIDTTLSSLVSNLYSSTLDDISSPTTHPQAGSPIRLTAPANFARAASHIYQPVSAYRIGLTRTNTDGTKTKFTATLETRMADYAAMVASQKAEITALRDKWETIVGEIWKVGVQCLGEESMRSMLFITPTGHDPGQAVSSSSSPPTTAESTLFVPEQATSSQPRKHARNRKKVSFAKTMETEEEVAGQEADALYFLHQPSRLRVGPVMAAPAMPVREMEGLEQRVRHLGQKEYGELREAERHHKAYWQKKNERLAQVLNED
ncbi:hypothetical protein ACEQ8H_001921 [Pleosporales sp. CAS-2024a]